MRDHLWAEALVLARRVCVADPRKLFDIESRFLATRPAHNPVMTLIAVASDVSAPILVRFLPIISLRMF
jgi:hypothetical protein